MVKNAQHIPVCPLTSHLQSPRATKSLCVPITNDQKRESDWSGLDQLSTHNIQAPWFSMGGPKGCELQGFGQKVPRVVYFQLLAAGPFTYYLHLCNNLTTQDFIHILMLREFEWLTQDHMASGSFGVYVLSTKRYVSLVELTQFGCICYIFWLKKDSYLIVLFGHSRPYKHY